MTDKNAYAYDPITNEDVPIRCHPKHQRTGHDHIDGSELPVVIESDFRHGPSEGCQGSYRQIVPIEDGCPNCGYDRMEVAVITMAGQHRETCRACGVDITDRGREGWTPARPKDPVEQVRKHSTYVGEAGHNRMKVYDRNGEGLYGLVQYGRQFGISADEAVSLAYIVISRMDEGDLDRQTGVNFLHAITNALPPKDDDEDAEAADE